ncbi:PhzF family phenazine biosynthesis protein [Brevibacillus dissolubilis]|uniref:PhzF family phenazine biosynthesis protein n=1 Tax=Brevibacillus dissolubilis TaxID=1844116 RepID=UPI0011161C0F|nr:PhzF family phenazine biosynthesis protein [Brevibacillus dissolubilis]
MRKIPIYHVDAFTSTPFGGNPAGVVPDASSLSEQEMQLIAREMNLPETAFLLPSNHPEADFTVRYFTPSSEINFCGHATLALAWLLATEQGWSDKTDQVRLQTKIGLVPVAWIKENGELKTAIMTQIAPQVKEVAIDADIVSRLIGVPAEEIDHRYPIRLANTGNWHLIIPVRTRTAIDTAKPSLSELEALNRELGVSTTHLFTLNDPLHDVYTRDFAPAVGIPEDPATGSANGALAGYLVLEKILSPDQNHQLTFGQGHAMSRPGTLLVSIETSKTNHSSVTNDGTGATAPIIKVGGAAVLTIKGELQLP